MARQSWRGAIVFWVVLAFVVWNGFFDILVTRGEKQYLLSQARHELGLGPKVTIHDVMSRTIGDATRTATIWAALILASGIGSTYLVTRRHRRSCP